MTDIEDEIEYTPENVFKLILMIAAIPLAIWFLCDAYDYFTAYYDVLALAGACNGC